MPMLAPVTSIACCAVGSAVSAPATADPASSSAHNPISALLIVVSPESRDREFGDRTEVLRS
jgi:hypothetical protein